VPRHCGKNTAVPSHSILATFPLLIVAVRRTRRTVMCAVKKIPMNSRNIPLASRLLRAHQVKNVLVRPTHSETEDQRHQRLKRELLIYCIEHPDAKDTVEGILSWWFQPGEARWRVDEVKTALDELTAQTWLTSRIIRQAEVIYGLSKDKVAEINKFLRHSGTEPKATR
jgi:hypothetical protein